MGQTAGFVASHSLSDSLLASVYQRQQSQDTAVTEESPMVGILPIEKNYPNLTRWQVKVINNLPDPRPWRIVTRQCSRLVVYQ
jgi:hypothetical protein